MDLITAAEMAYSEMSFTLHDIMVPDRRKDEAEWMDRRGKRLAKVADDLRAALDKASRT